MTPEQPKKVPDLAIFMPHLDEGGAERILAILAGGLDGEGYQIDMVLGEARGSYIQLLPDSVPVIDLGSSSEYTSLIPLIRYLRSAQPRVVLSSLPLASLIMLFSRWIARSKTRTVIRAANTLSLQPRSPLKKVIEKFLITWFFPRADQIIAVSSMVKKDLEMAYHISPGKIEVIYNPTIPADLQEKMLVPVEHPWFSQPDAPVILAAGRLSLQKDYLTLIYAFARVRQQRICHLVILGKGPEHPRLQAAIDQLGLADDAQLLGFVSNPFAYLSKATVFCHSARYEGLVNVLIEAMACGCPVVSTDCPGGSAEILAGGKYGHLVPVGDPDEMAHAILAVLDGNTRKPPPDWLDQFRIETVQTRYRQALGLDQPGISNRS
jgi:glycosyltransferase involved in cell wall biosynthesis